MLVSASAAASKEMIACSMARRRRAWSGSVSKVCDVALKDVANEKESQ